MSEPPTKRQKGLDGSSSSSSAQPESSSSSELVHDENVELEEGDVSKERLCGITEILGTGRSFNVAVKKKYEDFVVEEIDEKRNVVRLLEKATLDQFPDDRVESSTESAFLNEEQEQKMKALIKTIEETTKTTFDFEGLQTFLCTPRRAQPTASFVFPSIEDKALRTQVHLYFKTYSNIATSNAPGSASSIKVTFKKSSDTSDQRWPKDLPPYLKFTLRKENTDTMECISWICKRARVKDSIFGYAGTKDKRAITTQEITAYKMTPQKLLKAIESRYQITMGNFSYTNTELRLGMLFGNRFTILLRDIEEDVTDEEITFSCEQIKQTGFINYFGMQRFGTGEIPTWKIGVSVMKSAWREAIRSLLQPKKTTGDEKPQAYETIITQYLVDEDAKKAIEEMRWCEKQVNPLAFKILCNLERHGDQAFEKAFDFLPRNLKTLFVHSYQSYIWNRIASRRHQLYGSTSVVVGDLVFPGDPHSDLDAVDLTMDMLKIVATEEEAKQFSIDQVVLPVPGLESVYPENQLKQEYEAIFASDGIEITPALSKKFNLRGAYRRYLVRPLDFEYKIVQTQDNDFTFGRKRPEMPTPTDEAATLKSERALEVAFNLPSSSYATVAIRELSKRNQ